MKIVQFNAENIKKLRAVEITPTGAVVTIAGRNGQGKTSIMDSIWWALTGTSNIQKQPIRKGATKARIRLDLGELIVERKFTEAGSTLTVQNADGARFPSPQKMLDALLGELCFDPLAFARMDARKQFDELRRVAQLEVDLDKLDLLNKGDYQKRTDINRDAKAKRAGADLIVVPEGLPKEPVDESALLNEMQAAGEKNAEIEGRKARREQAGNFATAKRENAVAVRDRAAALRAEADELDKQATALLAEVAELEQKIDNAPPLPEPIDASALRAKLDSAKTANAALAKAQDRARLIAEAKQLEAQANELTEAMEARSQAKADAIAAAKLPVEGLGFGDGVVTYDGIPFDQCSAAEQLRVSMAIAMSANPKLRVIRITDGSLLDDDSLATIGEMAKADDYQVWIERVDASGKVGITIDDGAVVAVNEPEQVAQ